jgi:ubiquinone/menaquinone biosynthesis C-methylase UbiE
MRAFGEVNQINVASARAGLLSRDKRREAGSLTPEKTGSAYDFGFVAERYDDWFRRPVGRVYDMLEKGAMREFLPDAANGDQLLEVGCGTGHWSTFFAERGFRVTGLDISARMVQIAREKRIRNAEFYQADAAAIPLPDHVFDVVAAITLLEFVLDPRRALGEMVRCVRSGGCILVGVLNRWSYLGISRRIRGTPLFSSARFFSMWALKKLLSQYGRANVRAAAFFLPWRWALGAAPVLDRGASAVGLPFGDFLVGRVQP